MQGRQPIITGRACNAHQMPPHALAGRAVKSGIRSNSTKGGGTNKLTFDDTKGNEKTHCHVGFNHEAVIEDDETQHAARITLAVGGNSIKIDPGGVTVLGPMIKLN